MFNHGVFFTLCGRAWRQCPCGAGLPHKYTFFYPQGFKKIYNIFRYFSIYAFPRFFLTVRVCSLHAGAAWGGAKPGPGDGLCGCGKTETGFQSDGSKEKIQGTYFKICLTYFKISQTYFLPPENPPENRGKKGRQKRRRDSCSRRRCIFKGLLVILCLIWF